MSQAKQESLDAALSRYNVHLMLQMKRLLLQHGIDVSLAEPDAYDQLLKASQAIDDTTIQQHRSRLLERLASCRIGQATPASSPSLSATLEAPVSSPEAPVSPPSLPATPEAPVSPPSLPATPEAPVSSPSLSTTPEPLVTDTPAPAQPAAPVSSHASDVSDEADRFASAPLKTVPETTKGDVFLTCDRCQRILAVKLKRLQETQPLPISCACGMRYRVELDERKFTRKSTNLSGVYRCEQSGKTGGIVVEDLSFGGIRFEVTMSHALALNDRVQVSFTLDDADHSMVHEEVCVQSVNDNTIGAIFTYANDFDKALAAYLMR